LCCENFGVLENEPQRYLFCYYLFFLNVTKGIFNTNLTDFGMWISDFGMWNVDFGMWISDFGMWILECGFWISECGFWNVDFGFRNVECGLQTLKNMRLFFWGCKVIQWENGLGGSGGLKQIFFAFFA
jgi:hypothetical protein